MQNKGQFVLGGILVLLGVVFLLGTIFQINVWTFCWPIGLIVLGVWLVLRPRFAGPDTGTEVVLLGDIRHRGTWAVRNKEIWIGVADVELDMTQAQIPPGETVINVYGFVGDVDILVPREAGVAVRATGFVVDSDLLGNDMDSFLAPVEVTSAGYQATDCRVRIEMVAFVCDIKVRHV
jgi:lia operon protein LiaF